MKRKILIPTDFSDNAWSAIVYALKLFTDEFCTFYFLNTTNLKASTPPNNLLKTAQENALKELLELKELAETSNANANHDFQIILSSKNLKRVVKKTVKENHIDLVIMGTKGATGAQEFFFGSHTIRVIESLKICPVLVVPEAYDFIKPLQIAFTTDFNRFYDHIEMKPLIDLATLYNSKIRIVHINEATKLNAIQAHNIQSLGSYLEDFEHSFHWMPKYAKKVVEINDFIEELGINILAMVNYNHSFIEKILKEPVIKKIGFHPKIPFLVIPE